MRPLRRIIVHCSDTEVGTVESIRRYHVETKGWADIGYHYVIERGGLLKPGRPVEKIGAHCQGFNSDSIGVCVVCVNDPDEKQIQTLQDCISDLVTLYDIHEVKPHNFYSSAKKQGKTCPNPVITKYISEHF